MNSHLLAAEIVRRLPALAADNAQNAATVIENLIAEAESKDILKAGLATVQETLRDRFAMAALTGIISGSEREEYGSFTDSAYKYADCMMAARK